MGKVFDGFFSRNKVVEPYNSNMEYVLDLINQLDFLIGSYINILEECRDSKNNDSLDNEELNNLLNKNRKSVFEKYQELSSHIEHRKLNSNSSIFYYFDYIKDIYKLTDVEAVCLIASLAAYMDSKYHEMFSIIEESKEYSIFDVSMKLFFFVSDISQVNNFFEIKDAMISKFSSLCFEPDTEKIDERIYSFIILGSESELDISGVTIWQPLNDDELPIREDIAVKLTEILDRITDSMPSIYFYIHGIKGIGKKTIVKRFASIVNVPCIAIDINAILDSDMKIFYNTLVVACRESVINNGAICVYNFDVLYEEDISNRGYQEMVINVTRKFSNVIFVLSSSPQNDMDFANKYMWFDIHLDYPNKAESIKLWDMQLSKLNLLEDMEGFELANKFTFTPGQIIGTRFEAEKLAIWNGSPLIGKKDLYDCAYKQISHDLSKHATLIYAKYNWDQLILADEQKQMLKNACDQIKFKHIVYDQWGMNKRLAYGRGVSMLFAGPPGTGKTMAAQVVAADLGIEMYKVDLSQVVSKYIGETEKNLNEVFNEAKKSNVILFFDETDALLGKRTEVKDSHDKNANLETSYLLQKMEEYDGITVMSTNYLENIDTAFFRRLSYVVHFPFPNVDARKRIWQTMFPTEMPLSEDIDFDYLANQFEIAGGNIKNIAVTAAFLAAKSSQVVEMEHIIRAIKYELEKQGKILLKEDFGEYWYLLR